jgi:hypothetical protein
MKTTSSSVIISIVIERFDIILLTVTVLLETLVKHDLSVLCQSLFWTEIDVEVV